MFRFVSYRCAWQVVFIGVFGEGGCGNMMDHHVTERPTLNETRLPPNKSTCTGPKQSAAPAFGRLVWSMMLSTLQIPEKHASSIIDTSSSSSTFRLSSSSTDCKCFVKSSFVLNSLSNLRARFITFLLHSECAAPPCGPAHFSTNVSSAQL